MRCPTQRVGRNSVGVRKSEQQTRPDNGGDFIGTELEQTCAAPAGLGHHWGNNQVKSKWGMLFANQLTYGLNSSQATNYRAVAAGYIHYLHGVNPSRWRFVEHV